jgi:hypothetical protein
MLISGVYGVLPVAGFVIWNSHAFNLTVEDTTVEQYMDFSYSDASACAYQRKDLLVFDNLFAIGDASTPMS